MMSGGLTGLQVCYLLSLPVLRVLMPLACLPHDPWLLKDVLACQLIRNMHIRIRFMHFFPKICCAFSLFNT